MSSGPTAQPDAPAIIPSKPGKNPRTKRIRATSQAIRGLPVSAAFSAGTELRATQVPIDPANPQNTVPAASAQTPPAVRTGPKARTVSCRTLTPPNRSDRGGERGGKKWKRKLKAKGVFGVRKERHGDKGQGRYRRLVTEKSVQQSRRSKHNEGGNGLDKRAAFFPGNYQDHCCGQ
jgi:hypothetical protein